MEESRSIQFLASKKNLSFFIFIFFSCLFRGESDSSRSFFRMLIFFDCCQADCLLVIMLLFVSRSPALCPIPSSEPGCIFSQSPPLTLYISNRSFISSTDLNVSLFSVPRFRISSPFFPFSFLFFFFAFAASPVVVPSAFDFIASHSLNKF